MSMFLELARARREGLLLLLAARQTSTSQTAAVLADASADVFAYGLALADRHGLASGDLEELTREALHVFTMAGGTHAA